MQTLQADYFSAYHNLKLARDAKGVLIAEFHTDGGPFIMTAPAHTEFVDAFYRIAQDRANKIVILTGAGGEFITDVAWSSFGDVADPGVWSQVHDEGVQVLENIANIRVPVIAAIEGRAHVHSDYALLASVIVAAEGATFQDVAHFTAALRRVTESLPRGVIALEQDERRRSCLTHSRWRRVPRKNGAWLPKLCRTVRRSVGRGNWPICT
jgi:hypothetical protein